MAIMGKFYKVGVVNLVCVGFLAEERFKRRLALKKQHFLKVERSAPIKTSRVLIDLPSPPRMLKTDRKRRGGSIF